MTYNTRVFRELAARSRLRLCLRIAGRGFQAARNLPDDHWAPIMENRDVLRRHPTKLRVVFWLGFSAVGMTCLSAGCSKSEETDRERVREPNLRWPMRTRGPYRPDRFARTARTGAADMISGTGGSGASPPPSLSMNQLDPITVPDGTPAELLAFSQQLGEKIQAMQGKVRRVGPGCCKSTLDRAVSSPCSPPPTRSSRQATPSVKSDWKRFKTRPVPWVS